MNKILSLLFFQEFSKKGLADKLKVNAGTNSLKLALGELLKRGFIEYTIPDKPNSRLQKYRMTSKGYEYVRGIKRS